MKTEIQYFDNHLEVSITTNDSIEKLHIKRTDIVAANMQSRRVESLALSGDTYGHAIWIHVKGIPANFKVMAETDEACKTHFANLCDWIY